MVAAKPRGCGPGSDTSPSESAPSALRVFRRVLRRVIGLGLSPIGWTPEDAPAADGSSSSSLPQGLVLFLERPVSVLGLPPFPLGAVEPLEDLLVDGLQPAESVIKGKDWGGGWVKMGGAEVLVESREVWREGFVGDGGGQGTGAEQQQQKPAG